MRPTIQIITFSVLALSMLILTIACQSPTGSAGLQDPSVEAGLLSNQDAVVESTEAAPVSEPVTAESLASDQGETVNVSKVAAPAPSELSPEEISNLYYMREEEKLAHDVYVTLSNLWGQRSFTNISRSEAKHMQEILDVLNAYQIPDIITDDAVSVFVNADLQSAYNDLVSKGSISLADALKVGAYIEELDILDLEEGLKATTNTDVIQVYQKLLKGSINHLNAFAGNLERRTGLNYTPQLMSAEQFKAYRSR